MSRIQACSSEDTTEIGPSLKICCWKLLHPQLSAVAMSSESACIRASVLPWPALQRKAATGDSAQSHSWAQAARKARELQASKCALAMQRPMPCLHSHDLACSRTRIRVSGGAAPGARQSNAAFGADLG